MLGIKRKAIKSQKLNWCRLQPKRNTLKTKVKGPGRRRWKQEQYLLMYGGRKNQSFFQGEKCRENKEKTAQKRCPKTPNFVLIEIWKGRGRFGLFIGKEMSGVHLVHASGTCLSQLLHLFPTFGSKFGCLFEGLSEVQLS